MEKIQLQGEQKKKSGKGGFLLVLWHVFFQGMIRLAALSPVCLYFAGVQLGEAPAEIWLALAMLLYVLLVFPFRFYAGEGLSFVAGGLAEKPPRAVPYGAWLRHGLARQFRGLIWGIPFLAGAGYFIFGMKYMSFTQMWQPIQQLGLLLFNRASMQEGMLTAGILMALFLVLFIFGWRRDMAMEYLNVRGRSVGQTLKKMRRLRSCKRGKQALHFLVNFLLTLPAICGFAGVLVPYLKNNVYFSSNLQITLRSLTKLLETPLPADLMLRLFAVLMIWYLPLCVVRKLLNARLVKKLGESCSQEGEKHAA